MPTNRSPFGPYLSCFSVPAPPVHLVAPTAPASRWRVSLYSLLAVLATLGFLTFCYHLRHEKATQPPTQLSPASAGRPAADGR